MFVRSEKRRVAPWLVLAVGGLAAVGAISILSKGKSLLGMGRRKLHGMFCSGCETGECECD